MRGRRGVWGVVLAAAMAAGCGSADGGGSGGGDGGGDGDGSGGSADAAPPAPAVTCDDPVDSIWATPTEGPAARGAVTACSPGEHLDPAAIAAQLAEDGVAGVAPTTGVTIVRLAYRTVQADGAATFTSATAYLPDTPRSAPAPIVLVARSTSGLADACAPSREARPLADLALPFAARGFAVIAPDFSGLGTEGVHFYLDSREAVAQLLDGEVALAAIAPVVAGWPAGARVLAVGYSQGGGVTLSLQGLEAAETGTRALRGVVAIAPEWPIRPGSFHYRDVLVDPDRVTGTLGLTPPPVAVMRHYAWFTRSFGPAHAGDAFPAATRAALVDEIERLCTVELGAALATQQTHVRDLVDEEFRAAMLACLDGTAGCVPPASDFHAYLVANAVAPDGAGAPVLVVQGLSDLIMPAATEAACGVARLDAAGVSREVCADTWATHDSILEQRIAHVVAWGEARADGAATPACPSSAQLPACLAAP